MKSKIILFRELPALSNKLKKQGKKIVTTNGTFDILHKGHIETLQKAKKLGDILIVAINSDRSVKLNKGLDRPINNENDRAFILSALECVDYVSIFDEKESLCVIEAVKPNVHVKGGTYIEERIKKEKGLAEKYGGKLVCLSQIGDYSSTNIINKIQNWQ
ncbi:adenylyltransferase/cytidyltransferase family protein [archaeon]|nr:adenylyltransferase/cytidyltransferase family protein [archaeon]